MDYVGTHLHTAMALYGQREGWLASDRIDMQSMIDLEYRLRVHLHVLSRCLQEGDAEPSMAEDTFVYLASRFASEDPAIIKKAAEQACGWLIDDSPRACGARDALLLYPCPEVYAELQTTYLSIESLRPVLIYILTQHGARLPRSLTHRADQNRQDPYLQAQTLYYAAHDPASDLNMFRENYASLVERHERGECAHAVLLASIWGGLLRGDEQAQMALSRAIEHEADDFARLDLLRYAALTGHMDYFPILCQLTELSPELGYHLLALHGKSASVEIILEGLMHPRTAECAELAWWWVSGQRLPKKPRLSVVGEAAEVSDAQADEVGYIPDAQSAQHWWQRQDPQQQTRWLQGQPLTLVMLKKVMSQYTGAISNDLFDLYSLRAQQPILAANQTWHDARLLKISRLAVNERNEVSAAQKERQHA